MAIPNITRKVLVIATLLLSTVGIVSLPFAFRTTSNYVHSDSTMATAAMKYVPIIQDVSLKEFTQPSQLATEIIHKDMIVHVNSSTDAATGADMKHVPAAPLRISHWLHFDRLIHKEGGE